MFPKSFLQKSVHVAPKYQTKELEQLKKALQPLLNQLDPSTDSVLCLTAPDTDMAKAYWHGNADTWKSIVDPPLYDLL